MRLEIHKKGQGTAARATAYAISAGLVVFGAYRFFATFNQRDAQVFAKDVPLVGDVTIWKVVAIALGVAGLVAVHLVLNRPKPVDAMIETEQELRKVSWPTLPEVWNATLVVVLVTAVLAGIMYGFDLVLLRLFRLVF
jgi:preprotein translocase SecE subunit